MNSKQDGRECKAPIIRNRGRNRSGDISATDATPGMSVINSTEDRPRALRKQKRDLKTFPGTQAITEKRGCYAETKDISEANEECVKSDGKEVERDDVEDTCCVAEVVREAFARSETSSCDPETMEEHLDTNKIEEDSIQPPEVGEDHAPSTPLIGTPRQGVTHSEGAEIVSTELKASATTVLSGKADREGDERVRIWDPVRKIQLSGNAAPRRKSLAAYFKKHPERVVYSEETQGGVAKRQRISMWDTAQQKRLIGCATPTEARVLEYLVRYTERNIYEGQDMPEYVGDKRIANPRIHLFNATTNHKIVGKEAPLRAGAQEFVEQNKGYAVYWGQDIPWNPFKRRRISTIPDVPIKRRKTSLTGGERKGSCSSVEGGEKLASADHGNGDPVQRYYQNMPLHSTPVIPETPPFLMDEQFHSGGDRDLDEDILPSLEPDLQYLEDWNF